jgi:hypothetical protein
LLWLLPVTGWWWRTVGCKNGLLLHIDALSILCTHGPCFEGIWIVVDQTFLAQPLW